MELKIYKGFDAEFLSQIEDTPLVDNNDELKRNVLLFDKKVRKQLDLALLGLEDDDSAWITYEEYTLIKTRIDEAASNYGLKIIFYRNNIYPDYYPIPFELSDDGTAAEAFGKSIVSLSGKSTQFISGKGP